MNIIGYFTNQSQSTSNTCAARCTHPLLQELCHYQCVCIRTTQKHLEHLIKL